MWKVVGFMLAVEGLAVVLTCSVYAVVQYLS